MSAAMVHIPVRATYRVTDGVAQKIAAEYADVPADAIAQLLMRDFGVPNWDANKTIGKEDITK